MAQGEKQSLSQREKRLPGCPFSWLANLTLLQNKFSRAALIVVGFLLYLVRNSINARHLTDGLRPKEKWEAAWLSVLPKRHKLNIDWPAAEAINLKPLRVESISFIAGPTSSYLGRRNWCFIISSRRLAVCVVCWRILAKWNAIFHLFLSRTGSPCDLRCAKGTLQK